MEALSQELLEAAHCWEATDRVPGRPAMTEFRRALRYQQARWRESKGYPIGTQPIVPREGSSARLVGSRLPFDFAHETGAAFVTPNALHAARARTSYIERQQSIDHQRVWADLLWGPALAFNLFGDLAADLTLADRAVHTWWPDVPGTVCDVRFAYSPGRLDLSWLGSLSDFEAAFMVDLGDGTKGVVGVRTPYHDLIKREIPKPIRLDHYIGITNRSGQFTRRAIDAVNGTKLTVMWLNHLLALSMLQHESGAWTWARVVVIHPEGNTDHVEACAQYVDLLVDQSTYSSMTLERVLASGALPKRSNSALRERYLARAS